MAHQAANLSRTSGDVYCNVADDGHARMRQIAMRQNAHQTALER